MSSAKSFPHHDRLFGFVRFFTICAVALLSRPLLAQTGSVSGTVLDHSGAGVPDASVELKNTAEGSLRTARTAASGAFFVPEVKPGVYEVAISKTGFASAEYHTVQVTVGQLLSLNPILELAPLKQAVEVQAGTMVPLDLSSSEISNIVDSRRIVDLPLLTRDPYSLVLLSPGVVQSNSQNAGFAVNGSRERNNNFLLDGIDNNEVSVPGIPGGLISINPDSAQEFRVITNNYMPESGRNTGAVVDVISRSGTNTAHGTAYWFGRYNALAARDYFNTKPDPQDPFVRNQFGWSLGAPIRKDRTFFFVNNEYQRYRTTLTEATVVPTAEFKSGVFTYQGLNVNLRDAGSPNNVLGLPLDPTIQKALALLPSPNGERVDDVRGVYRFPSPSVNNGAQTTFKVDHRFSEAESFFIRYSYNGANDPNYFHNEIAPGLGSTGVDVQTHSLAANLISTFRPTLVNQLRAGITRGTNNYTCGNHQAFDALGNVDAFGNGSDYFISGLPLIGCGQLSDSNGQMRRTGTWSLHDGLNFIKGSHNFQFGGDFRYVFENGYDAYSSRTLYSFNAFRTLGQPVVDLIPGQPCSASTPENCGSIQFQDMAAGLLGYVAQQSQSQFFNASGARTALDYKRFVQHEYAVFAQDSWRIRPNLTLNYGLRYQFNGVPFNRTGNLSNLFQDPAGPAPFTFTILNNGQNLYNNDSFNFEPRVGFSWDPFSNGKTAIRGAYGIFHDRAFGNLFVNAGVNPPFVQNAQIFPQQASGQYGDILPNVPPPSTFQTSATVEDGAYLTPSIIDPNLKMPVSQNWNFGVQQEIPGSMMLDLNYVASKGSRLFRVVNGNPPQRQLVNQLIAAGVSPSDLQGTALYSVYPTTYNTAFFEPALLKSIGNSTYHSFQVNLTRRFQKGFMLQAAYTWSHAIDDAPDPLQPGADSRSYPRNSLNLQEERGNSDTDQRQRLILNYLYELPFGRGRAYVRNGFFGRVLEGWQLGGISTFQDGLPFDVFGPIDSEHTGFGSRLDLIGSPTIPSGADRTQTGPPASAFANPAFGRPGTMGRNALVGPGTINTDFILSKRQSITERLSAQLRFEFFNLFNRPQLAQPNNNFADPGTFGLSTSTVTRPDSTSSNRQIQLALKLLF